ncbi:MAG: DUF1501 domain-containing protein, partial [Planctomycetaceae bacterium]|nr:DUF1501 domain-containing protein [Planctomycetaceae bacterium]
MTRNSSSSGTGCSELRSLSRRSLIQIGAWSGLSGVAGLGVPRPLHAAQNSVIDPAAGFGKAKRCIFLFMWGGPSHIDTWDPKPHAPDEIRGEFKTIATNVPGIDVSELLPNMSQRADKLAVIRSLNHTDPAHLSSVHHILTGHKAPRT